MAIMQLIAFGAQDAYLTATPPTYRHLFDSLDWGELRHLPRPERVAHLHADWQTRVAIDAEQRYLVWAARNSPSSPCYGLPDLVACDIVDQLRHLQAESTLAAEQRYAEAEQLLRMMEARQGAGAA